MKINLNLSLERKVKKAFENFTMMDFVGAASMLMLDIDEKQDNLLIADIVFNNWKKIKNNKAKKDMGLLFIEVSEFNKDAKKVSSSNNDDGGETNGET